MRNCVAKKQTFNDSQDDHFRETSEMIIQETDFIYVIIIITVKLSAFFHFELIQCKYTTKSW